MVVGTADGVVQTFVVAGEVTPTWAQQPPACITQGRRLTAIRSEVLLIVSADYFCMSTLPRPGPLQLSGLMCHVLSLGSTLHRFHSYQI